MLHSLSQVANQTPRYTPGTNYGGQSLYTINTVRHIHSKFVPSNRLATHTSACMGSKLVARYEFSVYALVYRSASISALRQLLLILYVDVDTIHTQKQ